jgi:hypothetical protein
MLDADQHGWTACPQMLGYSVWCFTREDVTVQLALRRCATVCQRACPPSAGQSWERRWIRETANESLEKGEGNWSRLLWDSYRHASPSGVGLAIGAYDPGRIGLFSLRKRRATSNGRMDFITAKDCQNNCTCGPTHSGIRQWTELNTSNNTLPLTWTQDRYQRETWVGVAPRSSNAILSWHRIGGCRLPISPTLSVFPYLLCNCRFHFAAVE